MAKVRKFVAYRRLERPYTRKSRYREKSFIRGNPHNKIVRYNMGDPNKTYDYKLQLVAKEPMQIRAAAIESARLFINRHSERKVGPKQYYFRIIAYPHHHLRENALASGAGADRLSTGMKFSFGKVIGVAAQLKAGSVLVELNIEKSKLDVAKQIFNTARSKLPGSFSVIVTPVVAA